MSLSPLLRRLTLTLAAPTLALGLVAASAPAYAEVVTVRDASGDVYSMALDAPPNSEPVPAPRHRRGDVRSLRTNHTGKVLRMKLAVDRITRSSKVHTFASFTVKTSNGKQANLDVFVFDGDPQGDSYFFVEGANSSPESCPGAKTVINYQRNVVFASIPRRCLGNPAWVKVGAGSGTFNNKVTYLDDVNTDSAPGDDLVLGAKVRHG